MENFTVYNDSFSPLEYFIRSINTWGFWVILAYFICVSLDTLS